MSAAFYHRYHQVFPPETPRASPFHGRATCIHWVVDLQLHQEHGGSLELSSFHSHRG